MTELFTAPIELRPVMPATGGPEWPGATWVGQLDTAELDLADRSEDATITCRPLDADGYTRARILIRESGVPVHFTESPLDDGLATVTISPFDDEPDSGEVSSRPVSVVVCTRERPEHLRSALASLARLDHPDLEIIVVDNAPKTDATARVVEECDDPRVRLVTEPTPGLSPARNTGLVAASHEIVAFTDDDVVVDRQWITGLLAGFARADDVACVCGLVPSGELRTPSQAYFDWRVSWADNIVARRYSLLDPPEDVPLFPYQVGIYGTGANFAVDRDRIARLGGFDEALGVGTTTMGGEDLDIFLRVLMAGYSLVSEPSAIVWHRHRSDNDALLSQARGYGAGLGAVLTKIAFDRAHRRLAFSVLRKRFRAVSRASAAYGGVCRPPDHVLVDISASVGRVEVFSVLRGPLALARERRAGRQAAPLHAARDRANLDSGAIR